ncbi:hypothetical protein FRC03_003341 [Tulasnella sp. 419]|nr:hypothetical protein FRC03_003341 [Tulasnella sp. 419]
MSHSKAITPAEDGALTSKPCHIHKLPFDILYDIFKLAVSMHISIKTAEMAFTFSHVCRRWRQYALDIPTLWTTIGFTRKTRHQTWERQKAFLERSKDSPLLIVIYGPRGWDSIGLSASAVAGILRVINPHLHRWRSLTIFLHLKGVKVICDQLRHACAPALKRLVINPLTLQTKESPRPSKCQFHIFGGGLPNLEDWESPFPVMPSPSLSPRMDNLRRLLIRDDNEERRQRIKLEGIISMLAKCPRLERLSLSFHYPLEFDPSRQQMVPQISLPHLSSLDNMSLHSWHIVPILIFIKAPSLRYLGRISNCIIPIIAALNPYPGVQEINFNRQSWCQLTSYDTSTLWTAFSNLSSLTQLGFSEQYIHSEMIHILKNLCPHLIRLSLWYCKYDSPSDLCDIVKARMESPNVASLEKLHIRTSPLRNLPDSDRFWLETNVPSFEYQCED